MAKDWRAESAAVTEALVRDGRATWEGVGTFQVVGKGDRRVARFHPGDGFFESMETRKAVRVRGFGVFEVKVYAAYEGRNPLTGAIVHVPEKRGGLFRGDPLLHERIASAPISSQPSPPDEEE